MGFLDTFKGNRYKAELENLQREYDAIQSLMTPEMREASSIQKEILRLQEEQAAQQKSLDEVLKTIDKKNREIKALENEITKKKNKKNQEIKTLENEIAYKKAS